MAASDPPVVSVVVGVVGGGRVLGFLPLAGRSAICVESSLNAGLTSWSLRTSDLILPSLLRPMLILI